MRHVVRRLCMAAACLLLAACATPRMQRLHGASMGTTWTATWTERGTDRTADVSAAIDAELAGLIAELSAWERDSALSRFNRATDRRWHALPDTLLDVVGYQLQIARDTGGAYDPTVGVLVALWGFGRGTGNAEPDADAIAAALRRTGWQRVELDRAARRARKPAGIELDVSSGGPGFAVDRIAARLHALGLHDHLVELGGELRASGMRPDRRPWQVAIETPGADDGTLGDLAVVLPLRDAAIGASGDYRDYRIDVAGRRRSHFIDPRTGRPVDAPPAQVTVVADRCLHADVLATALSVLGVDAGLAYAQRHAIAARFVLRDGDRYVVRTSAAFDALPGATE